MKKRGKDKLQHKGFWVGIIVIFIASFTFMILSPDKIDDKLTGNVAIQPLSYVQAGQTIEFEVRNVEGLKDASVRTSEIVKNAQITFENINSVSWETPDKVYKMFKISSADEDKFSYIVLTLKVDENEIRSLGIAKDEVTLYHEGTPIETKLFTLKDNIQQEGQLFYTASSSEFGEFAIGGKKKVLPTNIAGRAINIAQPRDEQPAPVQPEEKENFIDKLKKFFSK